MSACQVMFTHCYFHVHACQYKGYDQHFSGRLLDKNERIGLYNFEHPRSTSFAKYPVLRDHDSVNNLSIFTLSIGDKNIKT